MKALSVDRTLDLDVISGAHFEEIPEAERVASSTATSEPALAVVWLMSNHYIVTTWKGVIWNSNYHRDYLCFVWTDCLEVWG